MPSPPSKCLRLPESPPGRDMSSWRRLLVLSAWVHLVHQAGAGEAALASVRDMVTAFASHHGCRSVVLIAGEKHSDYDVFKLAKAINSRERFQLASTVTAAVFPRGIDSSGVGGTEMVVVLDFGDPAGELSRVFGQVEATAHKWLVTTRRLRLEDFQGIRIPLATEFVVAHGDPSTGFNLTEIYETEADRKLTKQLGDWAKGVGLRVSSEGLVERRKDLEGVAIKAISVSEEPCALLSFVVSVATVLSCIHDRMWRQIAAMLNATPTVVVDPGLSEDSIRNIDADLTYRSALMTSADMETRSFPWPTIRTKTEAVTSYVEQKVEWRTYVLPFSRQMWAVILVWLILSDAIVAAFELVTLRGGRGKERAAASYCSKYSFLSLFALCNQEVLDTPRYSSYRIVLLMMFAVPAVVLPGYSGVLMSYLTVKIPKAPFRNLEELSQAKDYRLGWHSSLSVQQLLNTNDTNPVTQALLANNVLPREELPRTDAEGIERMCAGKFTFLCNMHTIHALKPRCSFFKLDRPFMIFNSGIEMKKKSWYRDAVDTCVKRMHETSVLARIMFDSVKEFVNYREVPIVTSMEVPPIALESIVLPFAVLLLGIAVSAVVLAVEIAHFKLSREVRSFP